MVKQKSQKHIFMVMFVGILHIAINVVASCKCIVVNKQRKTLGIGDATIEGDSDGEM